MKRFLFLIFLMSLFFSCGEKKVTEDLPRTDWKSRVYTNGGFEDMMSGKTYLPVYSHIYHRFESRTFDLTITVSIRNTSLTDSLFILEADYYNTSGDKIRKYIKQPVFIKPMETIEIVITEEDKAGGSGANFMFEWATRDKKNMPLFEAVMISTYGQQGLSFTTRGIPVFDED